MFMAMLGGTVISSAETLSADASPRSPAVTRAWSRATPPGVPVGVAYFEIVNPGAADELTGIESPAAQRVEMHAMKVVGSMMQMRPAESVDVPAGGRVVFEPNGLHAMLIDLRQPLREGERFPLTLVFRHSGRMHVDVIVLGIGAMTPPAAGTGSGATADYRLAIWPRRARSPEFRLSDVEGRSRSPAEYRGRVVVVLFGFTRCPDVCPAELFKLASVMKRLGPISRRIQVLFISLDPERDTPASLNSYVTAFDRRFVGLTGTAAQTEQAAASFSIEHARVAAGTDDYTIDHSTGVYVLDASGRLRLVGAQATSIDDFVHDLTALAME